MTINNKHWVFINHCITVNFGVSNILQIPKLLLDSLGW